MMRVFRLGGDGRYPSVSWSGQEQRLDSAALRVCAVLFHFVITLSGSLESI